MSRLITGFPSRKAIDFLAIVWGLLIAILARWLIVGLGFGAIAAVITYFVGMVNSGTTWALAKSDGAPALDQLLTSMDYTYYKKQVLTFVPRIVYVVASVVLFFLWK